MRLWRRHHPSAFVMRMTNAFGEPRPWRLLSALLRCCVPLSAASPGKQLHAHVLVAGLLPHVTVQTDLVLMYSRCGDFESSRRVFDDMRQKDMHTWNILISSYVLGSRYDDALRLLASMTESGFLPDHFTFPPLFKACSGRREFSVGGSLHSWVVMLGHEDHAIVGSSILDMYAKCGNLSYAYRIFVKMCNKDVVVWNSMISGFARAGMSSEALTLFQTMQRGGMRMDPMVVPSVLGACGHAGDLRKGKEVHGKLIRSLVSESDTVVANSLIDMYAKCGCLDDSRKVSSMMLFRDLVTYTTLISCLGIHGKGDESLSLFKEMIARGFKPNAITFTAILSSCSHAGFISQGQAIFESMNIDRGVEPGAEHYACMVDLLGRHGRLKEALNVIKKMPMEPTASVWGALLSACTVHKDVETAEIAAKKLFQLEPSNSSNYVALCSIYSTLDAVDGMANMRARMRELGLTKVPGQSWTLMKSGVRTSYQGFASPHLATQALT